MSVQFDGRAVLHMNALERGKSACVSDPARILRLSSRQHGCYIDYLACMIILHFKVRSVLINMCIL